MLADIVEIVFEDCGDGSILTTLVFENETTHTLNPEIPYDLKVIYKEDDDFAEPIYKEL